MTFELEKNDMPRRLPWMKSLNAKLGGLTLVLLVVSMVLVVGNLYMLSTIKGDAAAMNYTGRGRMRAYQALYLARRMFDESAARSLFPEGYDENGNPLDDAGLRRA